MCHPLPALLCLDMFCSDSILIGNVKCVTHCLHCSVSHFFAYLSVLSYILLLVSSFMFSVYFNHELF